MTDKIDAERRSANMAAIRSKGMKPEMLVRKIVHGLGYRYRLHQKDLPGKPDLVFRSRHKVVFVNGCFWHQHGSKRCRITRRPKSNLEYWEPKLQRNVERDRRNKKALRKRGWSVLTVWECEAKKSSVLTERLSRFLEA